MNDEGTLVVVGPFYVVTTQAGEPVVVPLACEGVRRYAEHNGEIIPYVDFRERGVGLFGVAPETA